MEECKYVIRKNKMKSLINNDLSLSSSDESDINLMRVIMNLIMNLMMNLIMNLINNFDNDESSD